MEVKDVNNLLESIRKDLDELYNWQTYLHSLKVVLNFEKTGKPYPEDDVIYENDK